MKDESPLDDLNFKVLTDIFLGPYELTSYRNYTHEGDHDLVIY